MDSQWIPKCLGANPQLNFPIPPLTNDFGVPIVTLKFPITFHPLLVVGSNSSKLIKTFAFGSGQKGEWTDFSGFSAGNLQSPASSGPADCCSAALGRLDLDRRINGGWKRNSFCIQVFESNSKFFFRCNPKLDATWYSFIFFCNFVTKWKAASPFFFFSQLRLLSSCPAKLLLSALLCRYFMPFYVCRYFMPSHVVTLCLVILLLYALLVFIQCNLDRKWKNCEKEKKEKK